MLPPPPTSTLFPYTTLFRSHPFFVKSFEVQNNTARLQIPQELLQFQFPLTRLNLANETIKEDRKSTRLNSSHMSISYAVFCLKKKINKKDNKNDEQKKRTT